MGVKNTLTADFIQFEQLQSINVVTDTQDTQKTDMVRWKSSTNV